MFRTVLVANRGEIARRVIRTVQALGLRAVAVYSDADARAPHVREADEAVRLGPAAAAESYLSIERVIAAAAQTGADAVHPGYGFLSENAAFARACAAAGIVFVGPPVDAIEMMGDKIAAKHAAEAAGVPVVPGVHEPGMDDATLTARAGDVGYPLLVKAAAGGGGKGMRVVRDPAALTEALAAARREAKGAFGDDTLLLERYVERPRHIEIQVLFDQHGGAIAFGERECSLQRRHQKIVEEAPSPVLTAATRERMVEAALAAGRACGYEGAGTVEFIVPGANLEEFFFLEMNTRLQVEHPVTELVWGVDLVEQQLRVAAGEPLDGHGWTPRGHAIEARVYAEDPARGFLPTGGAVLAYREPNGPGVRVDSGIATGSDVGTEYDPMLAKVIAFGTDRSEALQRLDAALADFLVLGVPANVAFLRHLLARSEVAQGALDTGLAERVAAGWTPSGTPEEVLAAAALARLCELEPRGPLVDPFAIPGGWRIGEPAWTSWRIQTPQGERVDVRVRGRAAAAEVVIGETSPRVATARLGEDGLLTVLLDGTVSHYLYAEAGATAYLGRDGQVWALREEERLQAARQPGDTAAGPLVAPMPGTVTVVSVAQGDEVSAGQTLLVVEAMKMEHPLSAPVDGTVTELLVRAGDRVAMDQPLAAVEPKEEPKEA